MKMRKNSIIQHGLWLGTAAVLLGSVLAAQAASASGVGFTEIGAQPKTLSTAAVSATDRTATHGAVSTDRKTLTFSQNTVRLVAHSGPATDMLSYRIAGLRNPTLVVSSGATIKVLFINSDDDMSHNLRFGTQHTAASPSIGTPDLAHRTQTAFRAADMTLRAPSKAGTYYYFCTIRGHAQGGMWGTIRVR